MEGSVIFLVLLNLFHAFLKLLDSLNQLVIILNRKNFIELSIFAMLFSFFFLIILNRKNLTLSNDLIDFSFEPALVHVIEDDADI
jgi:hypothetical protein